MDGIPARRTAATLVLALALGAASTIVPSLPTGAATPDPTVDQASSRRSSGATVLFSPEGNNLDAYDTDRPFALQTVVRARAQDPSGLDINGQVCFSSDGQRFLAGEDTGQPAVKPGWGIFRLRGDRVGELSAREIGKLTPTFQGPPPSMGDPYGCGILSDGRIVTTDIGVEASGPGNGQLTIWFPPFDTGAGGIGQVRYCKVDVGIATAQQIYVDSRDRVYVASARPPTGGVLRYSGRLPTSDTARGGCGKRDATGAPLATSVKREQFISGLANGLLGGNGIVRSPSGGFYVSSVAQGVIAEFDANGQLLRRVLSPLPGEGLGSYAYGTPLGLAIDSRGTLYYADLNLAVRPSGIGPGSDGKVWRIQFVGGNPQAPERIDRGLSFPDALGILERRDLRRPAIASNSESRTFAYSAERKFFNPNERWLTRNTVDTLREKWRFRTGAIITGSPTVATVDVPGEGRIRVVYFVSWDGNIYAVRFRDGSELWRFAYAEHPGSNFPGAPSVTVERIDGRERVLVASGEVFYSLDAVTGAEGWRFAAGTGCADAAGNPPGLCDFSGERNEILSSAIVADGKVFFGMDVNESVTGKGGFYAVDARKGTLAWYFDTNTGTTCRPWRSDQVRKYDGYHSAAELGLPDDFFATRRGCDSARIPDGCGGVWSSAALDVRRDAIFFGSTNCNTSEDPTSARPRPPMTPFNEAIISLDLDGRPRWRWRPREVDNDDLAFGGVPNLFTINVDGRRRDVVGIGNKDGTYYVVDRDGVNVRSGVRWSDADPSGLPYWRRNVVPGGPSGGIISTAAVDENARRVYFATAPGFDVFNAQQPTVHTANLDTGVIVWQSTGATGLAADASFGPTSSVPGLAIVDSALTTHLRIYDARKGTLLWQKVIGDPDTLGGIASGAVVLDGTLLVGGGVGVRGRNPNSPSNIASRSPASLVALCVPGAPECP